MKSRCVATLKKRLGVDVVRSVFLYFQTAIIITESLECLVGLKVNDFCQKKKPIKVLK